MDVGSCVGERLVLAAEAVESDVEADDVLVRVDTVLEQTVAVLESASELILGVDDLVGSSGDLVGGGEGERDVAGLGLEEAKNPLLVLHVRSGRGGSKSAEGNGEEIELHI